MKIWIKNTILDDMYNHKGMQKELWEHRKEALIQLEMVHERFPEDEQWGLILESGSVKE